MTNTEILQAILSKLRNVKGPETHGNYSALCPLHDDHRNSLSLHPEKGIRCFSPGCKAYDRISFPEVAKELGVPLPATDESGSRSISTMPALIPRRGTGKSLVMNTVSGIKGYGLRPSTQGMRNGKW